VSLPATVPGPLVADAGAAGEPDPAIHDEDAAMVAVIDPPDRERPDRMVAREVAARHRQGPAERLRHAAGADGVHEDVDADAGPTALGQRLDHLAGDLAILVREVGEGDGRAGAADRRQHRRKDLVAVDEHVGAVALDQARQRVGLDGAATRCTGTSRGAELARAHPWVLHPACQSMSSGGLVWLLLCLLLAPAPGLAQSRMTTDEAAYVEFLRRQDPATAERYVVLRDARDAAVAELGRAQARYNEAGPALRPISLPELKRARRRYAEASLALLDFLDARDRQSIARLEADAERLKQIRGQA